LQVNLFPISQRKTLYLISKFRSIQLTHRADDQFIARRRFLMKILTSFEYLSLWHEIRNRKELLIYNNFVLQALVWKL
jgi:hypothetical protein